MFISHLTLFNFKNYSEAEFDFGAGANALTGMNGSGKTNILEAIYYLGLCKSYFHATDSINIRYHESFFSIHGTFDMDGATEDILVGVKSGQKKIVKRNGKEYQRLGEHIGLIPIVMVAPVDQELITGGNEERRKLIDGIICQYDPVYLDDLINYNRILQQRNALLKQDAKTGGVEESLWQVLESQLVNYGTKIFNSRTAFIERFAILFSYYYNYLTQDTEQVNIRYLSRLQNHSFSELLQMNQQRDRIMQYTTTGIHRDDLELLLNDHPVKKAGSQGQQKSVVLALKLAQFDLIRQTKNVKPILLLDDIFDKLDIKRITRLMELVNQETFGQLFISDTNVNHIKAVFESINTPLTVITC